ncbi:MAG: hypothetical protein OK422_03260 [Thaumarchaeota archaeon]|nr:hypothetical protein [Nitrososphaerota archaeon]
MNSAYASYLLTIADRLGREQFEVHTKIQLPNYLFDLLGFKETYSLSWTTEPGMRLLCLIGFAAEPALEYARDYFKAATIFAQTYRREDRPHSKLIFPVLVSNYLTDDLASFIQREEPHTLGEPGGGLVHPVLVSLDRRAAYHREKEASDALGYRGTLYTTLGELLSPLPH